MRIQKHRDEFKLPSPMAYFRDEYLAPIPEAERQDLILAYHAQLNSDDEEIRIKAAKAWAKWERVFRFWSDLIKILMVSLSGCRLRSCMWTQYILLTRTMILLPSKQRSLNCFVPTKLRMP